MSLNYSKVVFDPIEHTYFLEGKQLSGISKLYRKHIKDSYASVPDAILQKAAERGQKVHDACRVADMFGTITCPEAEMYLKLKKENGIKTVENEYIVSDDKHFATAIDVLGDDFSTYNIKTTSVLDKESLSWQSSIEAVLFEKQNPHLKINKLYGIWLRDKAELVEVPRIPDEEVLKLLECEIRGEKYTPPIEALPENVESALVKLAEFEAFVQTLKLDLLEHEKRMEVLQDYLKGEMAKNGIKKWETERIIVSYVEPTERVTLDSKKLKEEQPFIYEKYKKISAIKESLRIKLKN